MTRNIRLAIVGAGRIADLHLKVLKGLPDVETVGITSRTKTKAEEKARIFDVPKVTDDLDTLIREVRPDGLLVLASADQIYNVACRALTYGIPVFLEKPAGLHPGETWNLVQIARKHDVKTMVGYNRRHYSVFHKGIQIIREHGPLMGVLVEGHERWSAVRAVGHHPESVLSGWLYANTTHTIDLLRFFGGEPDDVKAIVHRRREARGDQFTAIMNLSSGAVGTFVSHWLSPGGWRVSLYGQGVTVDFKPLETGAWTDSDARVHAIEPDAADLEFKPGFYGQMKAFCDLVRGAEPKPHWQDLEGAYRTMTLAGMMASAVEDRI